MESVTPRSSSSEESPNWLDLPPEVTAAILRKVGVVDILNNVQLVCTYWHTICKDPSMWRSIDLVSTAHLHDSFNIQKLARYVVGRSRGQLVDISIGGYPNDAFIYELAYVSSCQLRRLRIVSCCFTKDLLKQVASKFPTLEELEVQTTPLSVAAVEAIGRCCPRLKTFKCNVFKYIHGQAYHDDLVKMVAKTMPKLNHLELLRTKITNAGLKAILDGSPSLETLGLCSSYLCNLQVDDLGEVYSARYKKIVRYKEEPVAVHRYEHEHQWYRHGDAPFSDEDDDWDYDDDDDDDDDDVVEDNDDVDDDWDYDDDDDDDVVENNDDVDDDEDDDVGEDDDDEDDNVVDDDEDDDVVNDDEDDDVVNDDEDDDVVDDDTDVNVVDDDEDADVVDDEDEDDDRDAVDYDYDDDHDAVDDAEDDDVVDDDDAVDDAEDDDVVDDDDDDVVDDDDDDAVDHDYDDDHEAVDHDYDDDHDAVDHDYDDDHDAFGYDYDDDHDAVGVDYDYDDEGGTYEQS
ncbi:hypothetical protein QQ045_007593 [Rhodiola kirilowii]